MDQQPLVVNTPRTDSAPEMKNLENDVINPLELLLILAKHLRAILLVCLAGFVLSAGVALLLPDMFSASSRLNIIVMPGQDKSGDFYAGLMGGRSFQDMVIDRTGLLSDFSTRAKAYESLDKRVKINPGKKNGIIVISAEHRDPIRAAEIANTYADELIKANDRLEFERLGVVRQMLGNQLDAIRRDMTSVKKSLATAQLKDPAIKLDEQSVFFIESMARLSGGVYLNKESLSNEKLKTQMLQAEGQAVNWNALHADSTLALAAQYSRLLRELSIQEEILASQYELAKIDEAKNRTKVQLLDMATPPHKKSKPNRLLIVLMTTIATACAAIFSVFIREYFGRIEGEDRRLWEEVKGQLRGASFRR